MVTAGYLSWQSAVSVDWADLPPEQRVPGTVAQTPDGLRTSAQQSVFDQLEGGTSYSLVQTLCHRMYCLATMHTVTDRQTDDSVMPIADDTVCSTIG